MMNKIFVVNLERCKDKNKRMRDRLGNIKYKMTKAVDGKNLTREKLVNMDADILKDWKDPYSGRNITWGEVGCTLSHCNIYKECLRDGISNAIILEDDILIPPDFEKKLSIIVSYLEKMNRDGIDWDFCYLGRRPMDEKDVDIYPGIVSAGYSYWTCGYVINISGMRKIINSNILKNIIPIDEIIPLLGNISPFKNFRKYFSIEEDFKVVSLKELLVTPENAAFAYSDTENSKEVEEYSDNLLVLASGTDMTDGLKRFIQSCKTYGLQYKIMGLGTKWKGGNMALGPGGGQKINLLCDTIKDMKNDRIILVSDSYDVIMSANSEEILRKYKRFDSPLVFAAESACWPDKNKEKLFMKVANRKNIYLNSGGFIGTVEAIKLILSRVEDFCDDQRYYTDVYFTNLGKKLIRLDYNCEIFQCLNDAEEELIINFEKSKVVNKSTNTEPCHIHGNGPESRKLYLNSLENYLMKNRTDIWGFNSKNKILEESMKKNMTIYICVENNTRNNPELFKELEKTIFLNIEEVKKICPELTYIYNNHVTDRNECITKANKLNVDYYWFIDSTFIVTNKNTLKNLIMHNRGIVCPAISKKEGLWSNFWGAVDDGGWFKDSFDYIQIAGKIKTGCWNIPHIAGNMLINNETLLKVTNFYTNDYNAYFNMDMKFSHNCRKNNIFMFVDNMEYYGYIYEGLKDKIPPGALHPELFLFETDKDKWGQKYLHPDFYKCIDNWKNLKYETPCEWVFQFPFVNDLFCEHLLDEVNNINAWSNGGDKEIEDKRINNVENVPTVDIHMSQIGFRNQWESVIKSYVSHVVSELYSPFKTKGLNIGFVVKYDMDGQKKLSKHHDSSSYTIGIPLNTPDVDFTGGGTRFVRQDTLVRGKKGYAIVHPGRLTHYHEGVPIQSGTRFIFISFVN